MPAHPYVRAGSRPGYSVSSAWAPDSHTEDPDGIFSWLGPGLVLGVRMFGVFASEPVEESYSCVSLSRTCSHLSVAPHHSAFQVDRKIKLLRSILFFLYDKPSKAFSSAILDLKSCN